MNDVPVRKNSGTYIGGRDRLNFIEGSGVSLTVADDAANGEVDITIAATIAGLSVNSSSVSGNVDLDDATPAAPSGSVNVKWQKDASSPVNISAYLDGTSDLANNARVGVRKNSTGSTYKRRRINFIEGSNVTLTVADDNGDEEVDVTIAASGGGGTAYGWHPEYPPTSPHSKNDEFTSTGSGAPSGWTSFNPGARTFSIAVDSHGLVMDLNDPVGGGFAIAGIYKTIPSEDEFEMIADISLGADQADCRGGVALFQDAAGSASTTNIALVGVRQNLNTTAVDWSQYDTFGSFLTTEIAAYGHMLYSCVQIKISTLAYSIWFSQDGITWARHGNGTLGFTPAEMGIAVLALAGDARVRTDFFRITRAAASGIIGTHPDPLGGRSA